MAGFVNIAGKMESDGEVNLKYISPEFSTLEEAKTEWEINKSYPINQIEYTDNNGKVFYVVLIEKRDGE